MTEALEESRNIETAELGRPSARTPYSIDANVPRIGEMAALAETYAYETPAAGDAGILQREAAGVVAAILTWNCAFLLWTMKVIPALAAGNTVVVRPAPETPWQSTLFGQLIAEKTDIPAGVVNVVTSRDPAIAIGLTEDPRVDIVTFTGSTNVGKQIMAQSSGTVKKVLLELGGKIGQRRPRRRRLQGRGHGHRRSSVQQRRPVLRRTDPLVLPRSRYEEGVELAAQTLGAVVPGDPRDPA